jgi:WD40 repeat protein
VGGAQRGARASPDRASRCNLCGGLESEWGETYQRRLRWWDVQSGHCVRVQEAHQGTVQALKVSPDGSRLASCGDDGAIMILDLESGAPAQTLRRDRPYERLNITGIRGLSAAQKASLCALGAFEETSIGK